MSEATRFPLDFDNLKRGDYLPPEEVERAVLLPRNNKRYSLRVMKLASAIRHHFMSRGDIVVVRFEKDALRILTHAEQADYAPRQEEQAIRKMTRAKVYGASVDLSQLSDEKGKNHVAWLRKIGWRIQQMLKPPPPELTNGPD